MMKKFRLISALMVILTVPFLASTQAFAGPEDGYLDVTPPQNTRNTEKVEVLEYFWFGCPHCYAFEPVINDWAAKKPDHVEFRREAPPLNPGWIAHSKAFYAAEVLGVTDKMFDQLFNAIHKEKRQLRSSEQIAAFIGELGLESVDEALFLKTMNSFAVDTRIKEALRLASASGITGVPSIVINGKYRTGNSIAGGHQGVINVINKMVEKEHSS